MVVITEHFQIIVGTPIEKLGEKIDAGTSTRPVLFVVM